MELSNPTISVLGEDPGPRRRCNINANAFQQDAVVSFRGWQYAVFYSYLPNHEHAPRPENAAGNEPLYIHLARRKMPSLRVSGAARQGDAAENRREVNEWEVLVFHDYPQTIDDGHNTVQMGICSGDGTIHLAYDHHCDVLRYRHSIPNVALSPDRFKWTSSLFSPTLSHLPGIPAPHGPFNDITYPRFGFLESAMFLSFRDGKAGLGNDHLYIYHPSYPLGIDHLFTDNPSYSSEPTVEGSPGSIGKFTYVGQHLTGLNSNPYVNGITYSLHDYTLRITWVYRGFVHYPGWDDPLDTKHKQQAGPNGAENNHNLCYAYSQDGGSTWRNGNGKVIADLRAENTGMGTDGMVPATTITNNAPGIVAFEIPKFSGLMNQEAQAVDAQSRVHVLNRDSCTDAGGQVRWKHYFRDYFTGTWTSHVLPILPGTKRGRLATRTTSGSATQTFSDPTTRKEFGPETPLDDRTQTDLYIILPGSSTDSIFRILHASNLDDFSTYTQVWSSRQSGGLNLNLAGEPLVDSARLEYDNILSVFCLREHEYNQDENAEELGGKLPQGACKRDVVLLEFELPVRNHMPKQ